MADAVPTPKEWAFWQPILKKALQAFLVAAVTALTTYFGFVPAPVVQKVEVPVQPTWLGEEDHPYVAGGTGRFHPTYGWVKDHDVIAANLDPLLTEQFVNTPAGKAVQGDEDVFMWRMVRKVTNKGPPWYCNIDQGQVGSCVGAGHAHGAMHVLATAIVGGQNFEWKPISAEVIYGGSRVEIGGGKIRGDGSVGAWAVKWLKDYGLVPAEKIDGIDLTTYSAARARQYGKSGVPKELEAVAKQYPIKGSALVKSATDVNRALHQFYPVTVCSDQGFTMARDSSGTCHPQGSWSHCMCIIGYRKHPGTGKDQFFILNSWGDNAHTGSCVPDDAPKAGFWADADVVDGMVRQGDSFALSDVVGFPARKVPVNWEVKAVPRGPAPKVLFADGGALAW